MTITPLASTLLLTLLMAIGLFFFIRASVKDRTEVEKLLSTESEAALLTQLEQYFTNRAYRIVQLDPEQKQVTFSGIVAPSLGLAIFLSLLAAIGILCLALVLSMVLPQVGFLWWGMVLLAPIAGWFYWQKAGRPEQIQVQVESLEAPPTGQQSVVTIVAHRDELITLRKTLPLQPYADPTP
ncbi:cofactor assembly of complex C subunit B [Trichothermofontia sp.]